MRQIYRLLIGAPPNEDELVLRVLEQELGYTPQLIRGHFDLSDEELAKRISMHLYEAKIQSGVHLFTEYDPQEIEYADFLRLIPLDECDNIRLTPPNDWFTDKGRSRDYGEPVTGTLYFDYASASSQDLVEESFSREIIVSRRLKEIFESHGVTGLAFWPLTDGSVDERPVSSTIEYYLAETTCTLPPLDPRVLVTPWRAGAEQWNYTVVSEYYYTRERLNSWCDANRVYWEELSDLGVPPIIVTQRLRQLLVEAKIENVKYEPVYVVDENDQVKIVAAQWSWHPSREPQPILSLGAAREQYPHLQVKN